jgi:hypothetical protein
MTITFPGSAAARIVSTAPPSVVSLALGGPGGTPAPETVLFQPVSFQLLTDVRLWSLYD